MERAEQLIHELTLAVYYLSVTDCMAKGFRAAAARVERAQRALLAEMKPQEVTQ